MGCNCGGGRKTSGARSLGVTANYGSARSPTRIPPAVPTPTQRRLLEMQQQQQQQQQQQRQKQPGIGESKTEQERLRRLAVLRALGHA